MFIKWQMRSECEICDTPLQKSDKLSQTHYAFTVEDLLIYVY